MIIPAAVADVAPVLGFDVPLAPELLAIPVVPALFIIEMLKKFRKKPDIFILSDREKPTEPRTLQHKFKKILAACKISDISFHALRHTYATMCVEKQFDIKTLSELLGHSDVKITVNHSYGHTTQSSYNSIKTRNCCSKFTTVPLILYTTQTILPPYPCNTPPVLTKAPNTHHYHKVAYR